MFNPSLNYAVNFRSAKRPQVAALALSLTCIFDACYGGGVILGLWMPNNICPAFCIFPRGLGSTAVLGFVFVFYAYGFLLVCVFMHQMCAMPMEARRSFSSPGTGVTDICEPPCGC